MKIIAASVTAITATAGNQAPVTPAKTQPTAKTPVQRVVFFHFRSLSSLLSGKKYIKNKELGLFVILDGGKISITNHVYHYDVFLDYKEWESVVRMYDARTEKEIQDYEQEIKSQIECSLSTIFNKVSEGNLVV